MLLDFYRAVLPAHGHYCLFLLPERHHVWVDSLDKLAMASAKLAPRKGVYFGTSAFVEPTKRTQANVLSLRSLRLDIDAGPEKFAKHGEGKVYPTQQVALADVVRFSKAVGLAPSYIVSSGQGLHLYYALTDDATPDTWQPAAKALAQLCVQHSLLADPSVTEDTARVLRPVGSLHSEGRVVSILKATGAVYTLADLSAKLGAIPAPARKWDLSVNDEVLTTFEGPPSSALKITLHCAALKEIAQANGDVPEPQWRAMLGLVKRTVEGRDLAHEWSAGSDSYDEAELDVKFDNWTTGPTTCAEFSKHTDVCTNCSYRGKVKSPIMLGLMTAPEIESIPEEQRPEPPKILEPVAQGKPWDGCIPSKFDVVASHGGYTLMHSMQTEKASETGELVPIVIQVPITHDVFWFGQWADASGTDDVAQMTLHKFDGRLVRTYMMDQTLLASRTDLAKFLAGKAIHLTSDKRAAQAMENYAKQQFQRIKHMAERPKITDRMGLRILDDGTLVCAHGKHVIYPDGTIHEAMLGPGVRSWADYFPLPIPTSFTGEWAPSVWADYINPRAMQHIEFMRQQYRHPGLEKYQLAIMLGLSSPLMAFVTGAYNSGSKLPPTGLSVSLYSREGGRGKTTLMQAVMLAFGIPGELVKDQNRSGSTEIGRLAKLSLSGTMPVCMDEMGGNTENSVAQLISAIANGSGRDRATKDGGLTSSARWALNCLIATNRSQRDMVASTAEESSAIQYRLLELDVDDVTEFNRDSREEFALKWAGLLGDCAGALGAVIHQAICELGIAKINKLVLDCVNKASTLVEANQTGRFQYRALGAMLALQLLLSRRGMQIFELGPMVKEFRLAHDGAQEFVKENILPTDGLALMELMLHDLRPQTVITDKETRRSGKSTEFDIAMNSRMPDDVRVRHIVTTRTSYVAAEAAKAWCAKKHIRVAEMVRDCLHAGVIMPRMMSTLKKSGEQGTKSVFPINLLKGMRESTNSTSMVYAVNTQRLAMHTGRELDYDSAVVIDVEGTTLSDRRQTSTG